MAALIFVLTCLLPYVALPILRFPAETQPWAAILAWLYLAAHAFSRGDLRVRRFDILACSLTGLMAVYIYAGANFNFDYYITKNASFLFSLSILMAGRKISPRALWLALVTAVTIYAVFGLLQLFSNSTYRAIGSLFVPLRQIDLSSRGIASLTAEATDFGFLSSYMLFFILVLMKIKGRPTKMRNLRVLAFVCAGCVAASMSGAGVVALAAIGGVVYLPRLRSAMAVALTIAGILIAIIVALSVQVSAVGNVRGVQMLTLLITNPDLLVSGTTFSYRFISNIIGIIGFFQSYGLGYGGGAFVHIGPQIYTSFGLGDFWALDKYYFHNVRLVLQENPVGVFPILLLEYGVFGISLIILLWRAVYRSQLPYRWAAIILMTFAWAQSFPVAWPPFWLLVGISLNGHFRPAGAAVPNTGNLSARTSVPNL